MKSGLLLLLAITCAPVDAQTVYRCGPEGRSYSQTPCAQGRMVEVDDARSRQQRREALDVAERDRALADSLAQDRLAREAQPRAGAGKIDGRIGYARVSPAEPATQNVKSKKRSLKAPQHADRRKTVSATRS